MTEKDLKVQVRKVNYKGWDGRQESEVCYAATLFSFNGICWDFVQSNIYRFRAVAKVCGEITKKNYLQNRMER